MAVPSWKLVYGGRTPPVGQVVRPDERLSYPRMVGLGAQHIVAMFGGTFVFPAIMGLDPNIAILMSGVATAIFLLIVRGRVPSYSARRPRSSPASRRSVRRAGPRPISPAGSGTSARCCRRR